MVRLALVVPGLALAIFGLLSIRQGVAWHLSYSARAGRFGMRPTLDWVVFGVLMILAGVLPWQSISDWLDKRDAKKRRRHY
jgi:hypothetical protein